MTFAALSWMSPATASATVACPVGYETASYSPGLTNSAQPVTLVASGATGPCLGDSGHTAGTLSFTGAGQLSCISGSSTGSGEIAWTNSGTTPTQFSFMAGVGLRPAGVSVLLLQGLVTSGDFLGQQIDVQIILVPGPTQALACTTPAGLETSSGLVVIEIS